MRFNQSFIDEVMYMFDEERLPISQIAYGMNVSISEIELIICSQIANNIVEVV